jgi:hypothetical protein
MYFRTEKKKDGKYLDHLSKCHLQKKDRAASNWSYLSGAYYGGIVRLINCTYFSH